MENHKNPLYMGPVVKNMDEHSKRDNVKKALIEIDKDQNGFISYDEFKLFFQMVRRSEIMSTQQSV